MSFIPKDPYAMLTVKKLFLLLCCCAISLGGRAQEENQLFTLTRWHLEPDRQAEFVTNLQKLDGVYQENNSFSWTFVAYDDNTIEVFSPVRDYAGLDRLQAEFDYAWASLSEEEREGIVDRDRMGKIVRSMEKVLIERDAELSYTPAGESGPTDELPFLRLERYTLAYGDAAEVYEHLKWRVATSREAGSPLAYQFYSHDFGDQQVFEITYPARDRADLEQRMAEHNRLLSEEALATWRTEGEKLFQLVHTTHGTEIEELGKDNPTPTTDRLFAVRVVDLVPGQQEKYATAVKMLIEKLRPSGADLYWMAALVGDEEARYFVPIRNMSDLDDFNEQFRKRNYQLTAEERAAINRAVAGTRRGDRTLVMRHRTDLSYLQQQRDTDPELTAFRATWYEYQPDDYRDVMDFLAGTRDLMQEKGGKVPFEVWTYDLGGPSNQLVVVDFGKRKATLEAALKDQVNLLSAAEMATWQEQYDRLLKRVRSTYGRTAPELSYLPETME